MSALTIRECLIQAKADQQKCLAAHMADTERVKRMFTVAQIKYYYLIAKLYSSKPFAEDCTNGFIIFTNSKERRSVMNFYCEYCSMHFSNDDEYQDHLKTETHFNEETQMKSNEDNGSKDSEIYCVFCCKPFDSIDKVEIHVAEEHSAEEPESNDFLNQNSLNDMKLKNVMSTEKTELDLTHRTTDKQTAISNSVLSDKLTVYDADLNVVHIDGTKLDQIKFCVRCNRHFDGEDNLRQHQLKDHAIRKRKRSNHPNGVEGIVVTGDGRWSCDVCGREFPTLKQAKVHKFKSHIEPIQKQEMLSYDFMIRNNSMKESGNEIIQLGKYCQILPNGNVNGFPPQQISPASEDTSNNISPHSEPTSQPVTMESESDNNSPVVGLSQSSSPTNVNNPDCETVWKIKCLDPEDTKISLSKIQLKTETKQDNINATDAYNFSTRHYMCSHCPASFSSRAVYSRHILVHRRGKAFACDQCGMAFTRNHTLKQHKDLKCMINNPVVGVNCQASDQCLKCGVYFASSNSHLSHCKKICKIDVAQQNLEEDSSKDSVKSEETNAQYEGQLEIDLGDNENFSPMIINDFINNPAFVTKRINEFNCNLCCCYFASYKSIGHHLEHYHRIQLRPNLTVKKAPENENGNVMQCDFIHTCKECDLKYGSKEALVKHQQQVHASHPVENLSNKVVINEKVELTKNYTMEKAIKTETQVSPPQKLLTPSSFTLPNLIPMFSPEALNLSINQHTPTNMSTTHQISPMLYKTQSAKKCKVPPNANGEFECTECHKAFGCRSSLSNHTKSHFNLRNKPFSCEDCKQGFMSQISYQEHRKSQCPKLYGANASENTNNSSFSSLTVQYNISGSSPSSASGRATCCMHCNAAFPDRSLLEDHAAKEHSNESGEVICIMCTRSFTTYMAFRVHMTKSHGGPNGTPLKSHSSSVSNAPNPPIKKTPSQSPISSFSESPYSTFLLNSSFSPLNRHTCQTCKKDFSTAQALGNHRRACESPIFSESNVSKDQLII